MGYPIISGMHRRVEMTSHTLVLAVEYGVWTTGRLGKTTKTVRAEDDMPV